MLTKEVMATGQEVVINIRGRPAVKLVPCTGDDRGERPHPLRATPIRIADHFDDPLPGIWAANEPE